MRGGVCRAVGRAARASRNAKTGEDEPDLWSRWRREMTEAERKLWGILRDRRFHGFKFRRQVIIGQYIVDFVCFEERLILELGLRKPQNEVVLVALVYVLLNALAHADDHEYYARWQIHGS